jgi:hypothetical protein
MASAEVVLDAPSHSEGAREPRKKNHSHGSHTANETGCVLLYSRSKRRALRLNERASARNGGIAIFAKAACQ